MAHPNWQCAKEKEVLLKIMFRSSLEKVFVILMLMIGLPVVALADGWILWDKVSIQPERFAILFKEPNPYWRLVHAYHSYEVCQEKMVVLAKAEENGLRAKIGMSYSEEKFWCNVKLIEVTTLEISNYLLIWQAKGGRPIYMLHDFQCFPASFDPKSR